ncbi:MAG: ABC transporter ATP-binding protein/permease [Clostridia bacterium]|nr:ABC transporter ATP-binding protein/permease [Clostridia bacterium]
MLILKDIAKDYQTGDTKVEALRGIDLQFQEKEFAAILGPSGCGKTTLLNIIGGLDQYSRGDLIINSRSTKEYKDSDWDTYRNHSIGFVFQSYNLIPHQTVLANVELALTLSGVNREERRRRAIEALEKVGLKDQIKKKPNQMSGGQMQRVAIARALVNDPDILLADEPTGALDSETSVQVMEILKEISKDKLVIMVTHNPDLADTYASRIIRLLDGKVVSDSMPCGEAELKTAGETGKQKKPSMSFATALSLSLTNLMTKKGRTILTAFAGSIGIIGIALILSLSTGVDMFIERIERDTLSSYPLEIDERTIDMTDMMTGMMDISSDSREHEDGKIYSGSRMTKLMSGWMSGVTENNLTGFKKYLDSRSLEVSELVSGIQYEYSTPLTLYRLLDDGQSIQVNPSTTLEATGMMSMMSMMSSSMSGIQETMMNATMTRMNAFQPLLDNDELLRSQYKVLAGRMPEKLDEVVIIVNSRNELSDYVLYTLGLKDQSELKGMFEALMNGEPIESEDMEFSYDELMGLRFRLLLNTDYYSKEGVAWRSRKRNDDFMREKLENAMEIKVVGILKPADGAVATTVTVGIGYRFELMEYLLNEVKNSQIVQEQLANPGIDVFTGQAFETDQTDLFAALDSMTVSEFFDKYSGVMGLNAEIQKRVEQIPSFALNMVSKEDIKSVLRMALPEDMSNTLEKNLTTLGVCDVDSPSAIFLYPKNFESKAKLTEIIDTYNAAADEENVIHYTDYVGLLMSSITTIINAISYVLIAFVAISLVVSSIMIGIITYISVLERTKEIGILRAIGASKRDISRVFNAETLIVGFVAGFIGIVVTLGLVLLMNFIIYRLTDIPNLANLPLVAGLILVGVSMVLTFIAGLIPSRMAAKKDPVVALRTE